jgi:LPXTG-motif cell wall-anchored protein
MDDTDRISGLRGPARLRRGWLGRRAAAVVTALAVLLLGFLAPGTPAWAHNALAEASPAKKATLTKAPTEVRLRFLQKLDPDYTTITVSGADKQRVPSSDPEVKEKTGTIELEGTLANGVYTVAYQVVSTDGHTVKGSYEFTVADPAADPAAGPAAEGDPAESVPPSEAPSAQESSAAPAPAPAIEEKAATETDESSGNGALIGIVAAVVVVLAGLAGFLYVRRRKA